MVDGMVSTSTGLVTSGAAETDRTGGGETTDILAFESKDSGGGTEGALDVSVEFVVGFGGIKAPSPRPNPLCLPMIIR